ncbi:hypothetical protein AAD018_008460 [Aestuariibius insulae]|uniref:hypothetical protein n=1 Tax=Aestuariibius insulae TaxID=2058287 RepID=UPI00345E7A73
MMTWSDIAGDPDLAMQVLHPAFPHLRPTHVKAADGDADRFAARMAGLHDLTEEEAGEMIEDRLGTTYLTATQHAAQ